MKNLFILIFLFYYQVSVSQNNVEIGYEMNLNIGKPVVLPAKLIYSDNVSYFHWNDTQNNTESSMDMESMEIEIKITDSLGTINVIDYKKDSIYTRSLHFKEILLLEEEKTKLVWNLTKETKQIGTYVCYKATTEFRGRNYTAWYSPELSLNLGPWKLNGLPGLIMEAYDQDKTVLFYFKSLKRIDYKFIDYQKILASGRRIDIKEFEKIQSNLADELISKIRSKLPRGATLAVDGVEENFLEKEF